MNNLLLCTALLVAMQAICSQACCDEPRETSQDNSQPYPKVVSNPQLSTFTMLVKKAGLWDFFQGTGPFTLFAPSNDAFLKMDQTRLNDLQKPENRDKLAYFINYHIVLGTYPSNVLKNQSYRSVNGDPIEVHIKDDEITINSAKVIEKDIKGPNGVGYIINTVLTPWQS